MGTRDVIGIRAGQHRDERRAVGIANDVVLGTGTHGGGRVWPNLLSRPSSISTVYPRWSACPSLEPWLFRGLRLTARRENSQPHGETVS